MNKIKLLVSFLIVLFFSGISNAQVAIGTNTPSPSAQFEVYSTERGFLPPRMTSAQRDSIATPATGLLIFQTNNTAGYYYYNGTAWVNLGAMGAAGTNGTNGLNALIKTTTEVAGANCANGGTKIETGLDVNGNGVLEVGEVNIGQTTYICTSQSSSGNYSYFNSTADSDLTIDASIYNRATWIFNGNGPRKLYISNFTEGSSITVFIQNNGDYSPQIQTSTSTSAYQDVPFISWVGALNANTTPIFRKPLTNGVLAISGQYAATITIRNIGGIVIGTL